MLNDIRIGATPCKIFSHQLIERGTVRRWFSRVRVRGGRVVRPRSSEPMARQRIALALTITLTILASSRALAHSSGPTLPIPDEATIPAGPMGDAIRRGKLLLSDTRKQLPHSVGNGLNCTSCHLNNGTTAYAAPWVGVTGTYPAYNTRSGKVSSLPERINDCFQRSMNGRALALDSDNMNAILAYLKWLSTGVPVGSDVAGRGYARIDTWLIPNPINGKAVYMRRCASCHGAQGQGLPHPTGGYVVPPLWGKDSFNIGAAMARLYTAAAFVKHNMPLGLGDTLSDQEAVDVAAYFTRQPRPAFVPRTKDWPEGARPSDAR